MVWTSYKYTKNIPFFKVIFCSKNKKSIKVYYGVNAL